MLLRHLVLGSGAAQAATRAVLAPVCPATTRTASPAKASAASHLPLALLNSSLFFAPGPSGPWALLCLCSPSLPPSAPSPSSKCLALTVKPAGFIAGFWLITVAAWPLLGVPCGNPMHKTPNACLETKTCNPQPCTPCRPDKPNYKTSSHSPESETENVQFPSTDKRATRWLGIGSLM